MNNITIVNHKTGTTIHNTDVQSVSTQIWGANVLDISIIIRVNGRSELFDWDTCLAGNGVCLSKFQSALEDKIEGMKYKFGRGE